MSLFQPHRMTPAPRHKVFISYHHANDEYYKNIFIGFFAGLQNSFISKAVELGDIDTYLKTETIRNKIRDDYIRDATVTVVLIGANTWQRKHVDWEISGSIRQTARNSRCGLLGLVLPTHPSYYQTYYDYGIIPPRLVGNVKVGYAEIYKWTDNSATVMSWIHRAFERKNAAIPDNSYPNFKNNKFSDRWC